MKFLWDILFPIQCLGGCLKYDVWICDKCLKSLGQGKMKNNLYYITDYKNKLIQLAIHQLKYGYSVELGPILSKLLLELIDQDFDFLIPAPLSKARKRERGFNQAELLCKSLKIPINNNLRKIKNTKSQMTLAREQRLINLNNCFKYNNKIDIKNKKLLLIDDVWTTGSTMKEMTKELEKYEPKEIWYAVLAKGEG